MGSARLPVHRAPEPDRVPALSGQLSAVSLFDLCQFLMLNRKTGNLAVRSGDSTAYLAFLEGQLLSAADDSRRDGEGVVIRAVQWEEGTFEFVPGPVAPDRRIQSSTENILLEAARRIDEMREAEGRSSKDTQAAEHTFREKQARGASIVEAFRSAVADGEQTRSGTGWKGSVLRKLAEPASERLLLGSDGRIALIAGGRSEGLPHAPANEVRAWMDELVPPASPGARRAGAGIPRPVRQDDGSIVWAVRFASPGGDWVAASAVRRSFPSWTESGLPESDFAELERRESGLLLVLGGRAKAAAGSPARDGFAAWIDRRSRVRKECGIVVEDFPRYDWSSLVGAWQSFPAAWARREGRLESVVRASGARTIAWMGECPGETLSVLLELATSGRRVVIAEEAIGLDAWIKRVDRSRRPETPSWRLPIEDLGLAWTLEAGAASSGLPVKSTIQPIARAS